jgi:hypothetical protein
MSTRQLDFIDGQDAQVAQWRISSPEIVARRKPIY